MISSTAKQYKSELTNFANFVYKTYGFNIDSLVDKILHDDKQTTFNLYDVLSKYTASLIGTVAPTTVKHRLLTMAAEDRVEDAAEAIISIISVY